MRLNEVMFVTCFSILVIGAALAPFGPALASDCGKAKQLYAETSNIAVLEKRAEQFQKCLDLCPSFVEAYVALAESLMKIAQRNKDMTAEGLTKMNQLLNKAIRQYQLALKHDKNYFKARLGLAEGFARIGLYERAEEQFKKAQALKPDDLQATAGLKTIQRILSRRNVSFQTSEQIVQAIKVARQDSQSSKMMSPGVGGDGAVRLTFEGIHFDEWSSQLNRPETTKQLTQIANAFKNPDVDLKSGEIIIIEGHTDNRGPEDKNYVCSLQRSQAVKDYLVDQLQIDPGRIVALGFGFLRPRFPNDTPEHMLANRRADVTVVNKDKTP
jgi:outer membrane protein OmpA-like peptidoglycan-associated protein